MADLRSASGVLSLAVFCQTYKSHVHLMRSHVRHTEVWEAQAAGWMSDHIRSVPAYHTSDSATWLWGLSHAACISCHGQTCNTQHNSSALGLEQHSDLKRCIGHSMVLPSSSASYIADSSDMLALSAQAMQRRCNGALAAKIPDDMDPADAAPLLCAGVTVWNPIRTHVTSPGMKVCANLWCILVHNLGKAP